MDLDRRQFLHAALAGVGTAILSSCGVKSPPPVAGPVQPSAVGSPVPAGELGPAPRRTLRLNGHPEWGEPFVFHYLPPVYGQILYLYDTLLLRDTTGALIPWLASSYQASPDGLTHSFELRDNVRWHDTKPLTADDVVFTFEYVKAHEGELFGFFFGRPEGVSSVRTTGPRGVEIRLERPMVTFAEAVAGRLPIVPRHIWEPVAQPFSNIDRALRVGSGPYRLEKADESGSLYVANDEYFLGKPFTERIEMAPVGDELAALSAGRLDAAALEVTPTSATVLRRFTSDSSKYTTLTGPFDFLVTLNWNLAKGGVLGDVRFRRACALAVDRDDLVRRLLGDNGAPGNPGFLPAGHPLRVDVEQYRFDLAAANRLLDEAGLARGPGGVRRGPDGKELRFKLATTARLASESRLVARALAAIGVKVSVDPFDNQFFFPDDYQMALYFYGGAGGDPDIMRTVYSSLGNQAFFGAKGYQNGELDDLAGRQAVTLDPAERARLVARIQQIAAEDVPVLPLFYPTPFVVLNRSAFDQVAFPPGTGGPLAKAALVTGAASGGTQVRPIA